MIVSRGRFRSTRKSAQQVMLVPTMGNLHAGHLRLMEFARDRADHVVATLFVNPTQFGPGEDYETYPRTIDRDIEQLESAGVDAVWVPDVETLYPHGIADSLRVRLPAASMGLCDESRHGHFDGMLTVVAKLFAAVRPDQALFGEKDRQQLWAIRRMTAELQFPVNIVGHPTVREADGLAMSSRNQYLSRRERELAPKLHEVLSTLAVDIRGLGGPDMEERVSEARQHLESAGFDVIYLEIRDARELDESGSPERLRVALVAARLGTTRLIDNVDILVG